MRHLKFKWPEQFTCALSVGYTALSEIKSKPTNLKGQAVLSTVPSWKVQSYSWFALELPASISVAKSCPTLCHPMDYSLLGSSIHGIIRQEYWSGLLFPPPGNLPDPGIKPRSPALVGGFFTTKPPEKPLVYINWNHFFEAQKMGPT